MPNPEYEIDYNDERFAQVEADKQAATQEVQNTYDNMINQSDKFYQAQTDATKQWAETQSQLQQEKTDLAVEQIEQQKAQAEKDYKKEQSAAYVDWQKESNKYNANAEQMAQNGLTNTGYSESSQVSMYNAYQNRVAVAKEAYTRATLNYDNAIKEAVLQNNSTLAEIAFNALQQELEIALEGFQNNNLLLREQLSQKQAVEDRYYSRWQDVLSQLNQEQAMAEQIRQYNESMQFQRDQFAEEQRQFDESLKFDERQFEEQKRQFDASIELERKQFEEEINQFKQSYNLQLKQFDEGIRQFEVEMARLKEQDKKDNDYRVQQLALQKESLEAEKAQWQKEYDLKLTQIEQAKTEWEKEMEEKKRQFDLQLEEEKRQFDEAYGGSGVIDKGNSSTSTDLIYSGVTMPSSLDSLDFSTQSQQQPQTVDLSHTQTRDLSLFPSGISMSPSAASRYREQNKEDSKEKNFEITTPSWSQSQGNIGIVTPSWEKTDDEGIRKASWMK